MNEQKKLLTVLAIIGVAIAIVVTAAVMTGQKGDSYVTKIDNAFASKESKLVYLGRPTCGYCTLLKPVLDRYSKQYKFDYEYINTDEVGTSRMETILDKFGKTSAEFGTPYVAIVKDGKKIAELNGYAAEDKLFQFLQENSFIGKDEKLVLNYIDYAKYKELLNSESKELFVMVQTGCSYCEEAKPVLEEIAKEYNIKINILNIGNFKDDAEKKEFMDSLPYYNKEQWGTPLMLVVENKNVVAHKEGFSSKEDHVQFLKDNGYIKE